MVASKDARRIVARSIIDNSRVEDAQKLPPLKTDPPRERENGKWILSSAQLPAKGQRVAVMFGSGAFWAGEYMGAKQSFKQWIPLPHPSEVE